MTTDDRLRSVIAAQTALASAEGDLDAVASTAAEWAARLTGTDTAIVELAEGDEMVYAAAVGRASQHVGLRLSLHGSLSGLSVRTAEVLVCEDSEVDDRVDAAACRRVGIRSMVVAPLTWATGAIGVLKVASAEAHAFGAEDIDTLALYTGSVSAAITHARARERDRHEATHDRMTGLANRSLLVENLDASLARSARAGNAVAVCFVDLDGFKPVNDRLGHAAGDEVLRNVADRLAASCRRGDTAARLGGDEFVVVTEMLAEDDVPTIVERLRRAVSEPMLIAGERVQVRASIGVATAFEPENVDSLLARADAAMYADKRQTG